MITLEKIQTKLIEAIKHSGKTQKCIAEAVGVKQSQISCYIHGKKLPALDTFSKLCAVLDVEPADILCVGDYE